MGVAIADVAENTFLCKFRVEEDYRKIANGGPWIVMRNHMILKKMVC